MTAIGYVLSRLRRHGPAGCVRLGAREVMIRGALALGFRRLMLNDTALGHLALEPDCFLKERLLGMAPPCRPFVLAPPGARVANRHLLRYWGRYLRVIRSAFWSRLAGELFRGTPVELWVDGYAASRQYAAAEDPSYNRLFDGPVGFVRIQNAWGDRPPLLRLSRHDLRRGRDCLRRMGVPAEAWYVCMHCRESGYHGQWDSQGVQQRYQDYRDAEITSFLPAMAAVTERGGWCIRMGDPSMRPLPQMPRVIDYARSEWKSEWMDLFLSATCRAYLGTASGAVIVPSVFGRPCGMCNVCPPSLLAYGLGDLTIHKLIRRKSTGSYIGYGELLSSPLGNLINRAQYEELGAQPVDNSSDDIRDLALDLLDLTGHRTEPTEEDERLQRRYRELLREEHAAYGSYSRMGIRFLRKYRELLD